MMCFEEASRGKVLGETGEPGWPGPVQLGSRVPSLMGFSQVHPAGIQDLCLGQAPLVSEDRRVPGVGASSSPGCSDSASCNGAFPCPV